ncbi:RNA polymerase sigma factor [Cytobacillus oceanisediminis]|uniref:RNA polymerase subunit sigma n=1 Tax=Cytobacillus oceanisediminis 2691 TaxID=1196031 RepID=A0A160ME99_9BACI|nr:sigma-70 family RNA polymerase sigma factor [Cytobacillus oceanisediminis]AND41459.1 hypothetical protein A361_20600 [Cytobacillus oceanisediminis 2691]
MLEKEIEKLIKTYNTELRYFAYKFVRDWILVDDIMQEVYLKIFLKWTTFVQISNLKSWLYKITCNQCIDYLRSSTYKSTLLIENLEEFLITDKISAEYKVMKALEKDTLLKHIATLPFYYRTTIILHYFRNYSYKEISSLLCKDIAFVKNKLFHGRRMLREMYTNEEVIFATQF